MREYGFDAAADILKNAAGPGSRIDDMAIEMAREFARSAEFPGQHTLFRRRIEHMFRSEVGLDEMRRFFRILNEAELNETWNRVGLRSASGQSHGTLNASPVRVTHSRRCGKVGFAHNVPRGYTGP